MTAPMNYDNICPRCGVLRFMAVGVCTNPFCPGKVRAVPAFTFCGWMCPRCGTVHSPVVQHCTCSPPTNTTSGIGTNTGATR